MLSQYSGITTDGTEGLQMLKNSGWILTESALDQLKSSKQKNLVEALLDIDLREIGAGVGKGKLENLDHDLVVLQILKLRNISAPKANESSKTAPQLMRLQLTDGQNIYSAIEMESTALNLETKPGTKIVLKVKLLKLTNGQLLLTRKNMNILGGHVKSLVTKWELSRSLAKHMQGNRNIGAPTFIPFGQKIQQNVSNDQRGFKSLQQNKQKDSDGNSEFNAQRQDAIAEATKAAPIKKRFGGGNKTLVNSNVQKIVEKGYTEEQAIIALRNSRDNVEKALNCLKKREERQSRVAAADYESIDAPKKGGVSLFDFLENKIPDAATTNKSLTNTENGRFENNISSSFRKYDKENSSRTQHLNEYKLNENRNEIAKSKRNENRDSKYKAANTFSSNFQNSFQKKSPTRQNLSQKNCGKEKNENFVPNSNQFQNHSRNLNYNGGGYNDYNTNKSYSEHTLVSHKGTYKAEFHKQQRKAYEKPTTIKETRQAPHKNNDCYESTKNKYYPPLGTSDEYEKYNRKKSDSSSIIGFQNKEGNEQAKNALKTKTIASSQHNQQYSLQMQAPTVVPQQLMKMKGPPPPFTTNASPAQPYLPPSVLHAITPSTVIAPNQSPAVFHTAPITYQNPIIMQSVQQSGLKIGDLCLAKYWEDGKFYNAKITGISESTYVVLFTDYGNAEEVRKSDCIPFASTCSPAQNFVPSYRTTSQKMQISSQHYNNHHQSMDSSGRNRRQN